MKAIFPLAGCAFAALMTPLVARAEMPSLENCEAIYTVQKRECKVEHIFRCQSNGAVLNHHIEYETGDAPFESVYTTDYDLVYGADMVTFEGVTDIIEIRDPFSIMELIKNGVEYHDHTVLADFAVFVPAPIVWEGKFVLHPKNVVIDGKELLHATYYPSLELVPGGERVRGSEEWYIEPDEYVGITGETIVAFSGYEKVTNQRPMQFISPGETGFLSKIPIYDCGALSLLNTENTTQEIRG